MGSQSQSVDECLPNPEIVISEENPNASEAEAVSLDEEQDSTLSKESGGKSGKVSKGLKKTKSKVCNVL